MRPSLFLAPSLTLSSRIRSGLCIIRARRPASSSRLHATTTTTTTTRRTGDGDNTIIVSPEGDDDDPSSLTSHSASVILCHGLGDTAEGWTEPARYLASRLPHVKFILPTAPTRPVTMNMGMAMPAWYDIEGSADATTDDVRSTEPCDGLDESSDRIAALVEEEAVTPPSAAVTSSSSSDIGNTSTTLLPRHSVDYSRVVLAGFSQGGALALYAGMTQRRRRRRRDDGGSQTRGLGLAGIVVMSGYLPRPHEFSVASGSEHTPILHCHGIDDTVVPVRATELGRERVSKLVGEMTTGAATEGVGGEGGNDTRNTYEVKTYAGLQHGVSMEELDDVVEFLGRVIPPIT